MKLADDTYEYLKQAVADMFVDYDIKGTPISSFEVAVKIGLYLVPYSALKRDLRLQSIGFSKDGFSVETNDNRWIIYYNDEDMDYSRINQTIMHEVAHYVLGHTTDGEEEEAEAKFFAKYALASPALIHNMSSEKTVENVMESFSIGYQAANIALSNYRKRLRYGKPHYMIYEKQILMQLEIEKVSS